MGVIYRGEDLKLDRIVALKFLALEFVRDSHSNARFVHEAKVSETVFSKPRFCEPVSKY